MKLKNVCTLRGHRGPVLNCKFSPNGKYCMSCGYDRTIKLWNPHSNLEIETYKGHSYEILDLDITPDNSKFASCGKDRTILLWDVEYASRGPSRRIRAHDQTMNAVCYSFNGSVLFSGSDDRTVKIWDLLLVLLF